ncbi:MAG: phenylalanine--tRNA ligase subunit alpha [Candidatus Marsarchaeota archaeon]|nr:phenylalanine--tRNA ligase subunit alpha [Candidatus Marsarchaeota archaeon]
MHDYELKVLYSLKEGPATPEAILKSTGMSEDSFKWAVENLSEKGAIAAKYELSLEVEVSEEGLRYISSGFPEEALLKRLSSSQTRVSDIGSNIALLWAKRNGWASISEGEVSITAKGLQQLKKPYGQRELLEEISEILKDADSLKKSARLKALYDSKRLLFEELSKRKLIKLKEKRSLSSVSISDVGLALLESEVEQSSGSIGQLTRELMKSGEWKNRQFKPYNVNAEPEAVYPARMHPVHEFIDVIRNVWISMGFVETSGPIIESSFWNFDVLFSPQDHPTREMQDTFFLSNPETSRQDDKGLLRKVMLMHKRAWSKNWSESLASQALLRTHTTSVSAHNIYKYGNLDAGAYPLKLFSIGKVFRNESIDYKHLAELHQYDGIIIDKDLGVSQLKHTLTDFYNALGFKVRFKPSYFPFVEPGLEVNYYDEGHEDWIELCGGGIIRKEITQALGSKMRVLAWGGGLERLMFKFLSISSLTELYKNNIGWLRSRKNIML